jgi:hypothetical protein
VFIGGLDRTGKSLLRVLLTAHPSLAISRRAYFWTALRGRFGDLGNEHNLERCLIAATRAAGVRDVAIDADRVRRDFGQGERTYERLFGLIHEQYAERLGKRRWGDQTTGVERLASVLFGAFPAARFLHMVRDPRDRFAAGLGPADRRRGGAGAATAMWLDSVALAERNTARYPDRYRIVRYETLVSDPAATLRAVCDFIGEPYTPTMLEMSGGGSYTESGANSSYGPIASGTISTASVGRYRDVLSPRTIAFIQAYAGEAMSRHGYELEPIRLSSAERLRYVLLDGPADRLRMALWRRREARRDRQGRRPSARSASTVESPT